MKKTKMTEKGEVVLTDSPEEARTLQKSIPVIGICTPGQDKSWSGISFLAEDWIGKMWMMNMQNLRTADIIICQGYWFVESGQW